VTGAAVVTEGVVVTGAAVVTEGVVVTGAAVVTEGVVVTGSSDVLPSPVVVSSVGPEVVTVVAFEESVHLNPPAFLLLLALNDM